ncbi:inositol monophosphatase 3-like [Ruditapes philippinarum]|uniref:inositol monophosphatase 3-like n=1 Tax=Ruditapes philippinarum TaxID=129788 RepID=UPI00295B7DD5|nr:inositol monophosphatase 3-like [Ruditapes philippinarum]
MAQSASNMAPINVRINPLGGAVVICIVLVLFFYVFGLPDFFTHAEERVSMKELLSASVVLARRGGDRVKEIRRADTLHEKVKGETKEGAKELVSHGDMESHNAIFYGLAKAFPGLYVVSEEHEKTPLDFSKIPDIDLHLPEVEAQVLSDQSIPKSEITVWIDPLDATQEYTEMKDKDGSDMLHYVTTMVCVAVNGQPTIGVIHNPFVNNDKGETTWAWVGYGHSDNLKKEKTKRSETDPHRVIVSRSHQGSVTDTVKSSLGKVDVTLAGGAGYKTLEVIKGNQDAYVHTTLIKKWDICAGNAILSSLDGKMTTLDGKHIDYRSGDQPKNEGGLLATTYNHDTYLEKLSHLKNKS